MIDYNDVVLYITSNKIHNIVFQFYTYNIIDYNFIYRNFNLTGEVCKY